MTLVAATRGLFLMAVTSSALSAADISDVVESLDARQTSLSQFRINFACFVYEVDHEQSVFDEANWTPVRTTLDVCLDYEGEVLLLAPDSFFVELRAACGPAFERRDQYSWHDRKLRVLGGLVSGDIGAAIQRQHIAGALSFTLVATPVGYRVFDKRYSFAEFLRYASTAKVSTVPRSEEIIVEGAHLATPERPDATETRFSLRMDAARDWLPLEFNCEFSVDGQSLYTFRYITLESDMRSGVWLPTRAQHAIEKPNNDKSFVTDWHFTSAVHDPSITADTIEVVFPEGAFVQDYIHEKQWFVGPQGERLEEAPIPEFLAESLLASQEGAAAAEQLRLARRSVFPYIVGGAVLITAVVVLLQWRRSTGVV